MLLSKVLLIFGLINNRKQETYQNGEENEKYEKKS